ncbi:MAG: hypothetical protein ACRDT2_17650 [Natronosporangium sp.]
MRDFFRSVRQRRRHFAAFRRAERAQRRLSRSTNPHARAAALLELSDCEYVMSATASAFAGAGEPDDDGYDLPVSHVMSGRLLRLLAATELALEAGQGWVVDEDDPLHRLAGGELQALTRIRPVADRAKAVIDLCSSVVGYAGGQAAETLATIAACYCDAAGLDGDQARALLG